jgi:hypothetical protein
LQFCVQFLYKPDWLFNFKDYIPSFFQNKNPSNTEISFLWFHKANGFFLTEPSGFSQTCAYGLLFSFFLQKAFWIFLVFLGGLLCSISGTGLVLALPIIFWFLFVGDFIQRFHALCLILLFCLFTIFGGFYIWETRLQEFKGGASIVTSSAAARFVNPLILVRDSLSSSIKNALIGQGPGTIQRSIKDFDFHDPTYAKVLYEYGILGLIGYLMLFVRRFFSFNKPLILSFLMIVQLFFLGGNLLSLNNLSFFMLYCLFVKNE